MLTSHMRELLAASLKVVPVLGLDGILDGAWHRVVGAEDGALDELELPGGIALEAARLSRGPAGLDALPPGFGRAAVDTALVWRWHTAGHIVPAGLIDVRRRTITAGVGAVLGVRLGQAVRRRWARVWSVMAAGAALGVVIAKGAAGAGGVVVQQRLLGVMFMIALLLGVSIDDGCPWLIRSMEKGRRTG